MSRTPEEEVVETLPEVKTRKTRTVLDTEVVDDGSHIKTYSSEEYKAMSKANGTTMGRPAGVKTKLSTEELRVLINEKWTAEEVKDKHGLNDEDLKQVVWKLSQEERLDKPLKFGKL